MKTPDFLQKTWFPLFFLLCSALLIYLQTFNGVWVMDDHTVIEGNFDIRSFSNFLANTFPGRPLRELTYLFDYYLFGLEPWGYHFQNIFWHALNAWLVYLLVVRLNLSRSVAWLSSLLFLAHPIHVEVVANSSHRKDSLALAFILMALLCYMKLFDKQTLSQRISYLLVTILLWITAFFAKGNSLVFPALVLIYEYACVPQEKRLVVRWQKMMPALFVIFFISLIGWYFYISSLPSFKMAVIAAFIKTESLSSFSTAAYIMMILKSFAFMVSKLIVPVNLSMEYIYLVPDSFVNIWVIAGILISVAALIISFRWRKSSPELFFLFLSAAILWLPTSNLLWHFSYFAADRYLYAPSAFLCIVAVLASKPFLKRYLLVAWLPVIFLFALLTWKQSDVWSSDMKLCKQILKISPRSLEAMVGLATAYHSIGDYRTAILYAQMGIDRDFTDCRSYVALGSAYDELGDSEMAITVFKSAIKHRPEHYLVHMNLGVVYDRLGRFEEALDSLERSLQINPRFSPSWFNLGVTKYKKGDSNGARKAFEEAVSVDPSNLDALENLSIVCKETDDEQCYAAALQRMNRLDPGRISKSLPPK